MRYRLEVAVVRAATWITPKLPRSVVCFCGNIMGTLGWLVDGRGRHNGMENLRAALGARYTVPQRRRLLRGSYRVFARTFLDLFWSPRLTEKDFDRFFTYECDNPAVRAAIESNNCIYIIAHLGGFELLGVAKALRNQGSMTIAQDFKNAPLTAIFQHLRSAGGRQPIIPREGAVLRIYKHLKKGGSAGALADLSVKPEQNATIIRSFGMLASVSYFHCALAQRTGLPILLLCLLPAAGGRWVVRFFDPVWVAEEDNLQNCAQRCWDVFEPVIREHPQQWLWMYKHWRYLPAEAAPESYPEYARRHDGFDKLQRELFPSTAPGPANAGAS